MFVCNHVALIAHTHIPNASFDFFFFALVFTRYQFKQQILNDLGALGFERLKSNVVATYSDEEEVRWLSETARHIEMLPGLKVEGRDWWDNAEFPWIKLLEDNYDVILAEFKNLEATHLVSWPEKYLCTKGWDVFPFKAFNNVMEKNCQLCPKTAAIIEQIPLCTTAMFSCLQPRTHIKPHVRRRHHAAGFICFCCFRVLTPLTWVWVDRLPTILREDTAMPFGHQSTKGLCIEGQLGRQNLGRRKVLRIRRYIPVRKPKFCLRGSCSFLFISLVTDIFLPNGWDVVAQSRGLEPFRRNARCADA
jgi:beta-hydroxylase